MEIQRRRWLFKPRRSGERSSGAVLSQMICNQGKLCKTAAKACSICKSHMLSR